MASLSLVTVAPCLSTSLVPSRRLSRGCSIRPLQRRIRTPTSCAMNDDGNSNSSSWSSPADFVKFVGQKVWGRSLPPGALVTVVKEVWTTGWLTMMAQLAPPTDTKDYSRPTSQFRNRPPPSAKPGQFHLYVALACPWAHRTAIVHSLKGLHDAVPVSVAVPGATGLWEFTTGHQQQSGARLAPTLDRANGLKRVTDVYKSQPGGYNGRSTVPLLWDSSQKRVVNNESADIIEILNSDFNHLAANPELDLSPQHLQPEMARWNDLIYRDINNGVYRCGFAQSQEAYERAVEQLFVALDTVDAHLATSRYLCGDALTLADIRLFTTLFRFDPVYHILFKCSKQKLSEYANLNQYMRDVYQIPGVASTCDLDAIMHGYYKVLFPLNPGVSVRLCQEWRMRGRFWSRTVVISSRRAWQRCSAGVSKRVASILGVIIAPHPSLGLPDLDQYIDSEVKRHNNYAYDMRATRLIFMVFMSSKTVLSSTGSSGGAALGDLETTQS